MSAGHIELVREGFEAFDRRDIDGWLATLDPEVELRTSGVFPDVDRSYRGHDGARKFWDDLREPWRELHGISQRIEEHGEFAVLGVEFHAVGARSGAKFELEYAIAYRFGSALVTTVAAFLSFDAAVDTIRSWQAESDQAGISR